MYVCFPHVLHKIRYPRHHSSAVEHFEFSGGAQGLGGVIPPENTNKRGEPQAIFGAPLQENRGM